MVNENEDGENVSDEEMEVEEENPAIGTDEEGGLYKSI